MLFCTNCGAQNGDNDAFCTNCGAQLNAPAEVVEQPVVEVVAAEEKKGNGMGIASLICGILGVTCCCGSFLAPILSIVFACISKKNTGKNGLATAGLILGIIGLVLGVVGIIGYIIYMIAYGAMLSSGGYYYY